MNRLRALIPISSYPLSLAAPPFFFFASFQSRRSVGSKLLGHVRSRVRKPMSLWEVVAASLTRVIQASPWQDSLPGAGFRVSQLAASRAHRGDPSGVKSPGSAAQEYGVQQAQAVCFCPTEDSSAAYFPLGSWGCRARRPAPGDQETWHSVFSHQTRDREPEAPSLEELRGPDAAGGPRMDRPG